MERDEIWVDIREDKEHEWLPYLKNDVLSTAFFCAKYPKSKEEITNLGMKNSVRLSVLANKSFNILRDDIDEPIYTYNDNYMRYFVRKPIKGGHCPAIYQ